MIGAKVRVADTASPGPWWCNVLATTHVEMREKERYAHVHTKPNTRTERATEELG